MTEPRELRWLGWRVTVRARVSRGIRRSVSSVPAALQIVIAATAAYAIAHYLLGHAIPLIAVTATITSLGIARDARPSRVLNTSVGILIGIVLSEVLILVIGRGVWQLAVVLLVTLLVARALSPSPVFAVAAAVQSMLVVLLPDPEGGAFTRSVDGVVAGVVALAATALIPRDPRREAKRDGRTLFSVIDEALGSAVEGLTNGDEPAAELALARLRRPQALVDSWTASLDTAIAVARVSPWLRRHLPELNVHLRVLTGADFAARHLRLIVRRIDGLLRSGVPQPELAGLLAEIATAIRLLGAELDDRELAGASSSILTDLASRLLPARIVPSPDVAQSVIIVLLRPLVVDLLVATGMRPNDARALLPPV